jgi:YD repeat-containing protein
MIRLINKKQIFCSFLVLISLVSKVTFAQETVTAIPDFYRDPGLYPNRSYVNQQFNEFIDPFTGTLQQHYVDLFLPGNGGFDLKVVRSYNSAIINADTSAVTEKTLAGWGWTIHFGRVIKQRNQAICSNVNQQTVIDNPVLELPDGSRQLLVFTGASSPLMLTTQRWRADCLAGGAGMRVYSPDGTQYEMTLRYNLGELQSWYTTKIIDKNGNSADIAYANQSVVPEITNITTNDGRSVNFSYLDGGTTKSRVSRISSAGKEYRYSYRQVIGLSDKPFLDGYFLTLVQRPDGLSWKYQYNDWIKNSTGTVMPGSYLMTGATHPNGGAVSYDYTFAIFDSKGNPSKKTPVVTKKNSSNQGTWTFTYRPGDPVSRTLDTTTVNTPTGTITYQHFGPNASQGGSVWKVGLLISKTIAGLQTESYDWGSQKISNENYFRPGQFVSKVDVGATNAPLLTRRTIGRNGASYTTEYSSFDEHGNPKVRTESGPNGQKTVNLSYYINTSKWIVNQVQNESFSGSSIGRQFDSQGNLLSVSQDGVITSHTYDSQGNIVSTTFPRGLTHQYSNYKRGIPQTEIQPEGVSIARGVSAAGNIISESNGEGKTTSYGYDGLDRVVSITYPSGSSVNISYGANSRVATRGSLTESTSYDGFGFPTAVTLGGVTRKFGVDVLGRRTFVSNPGADQGTRYDLDALNRVTKITNSDGSTQQIVYGAGSKTVIDERGNSTTYSYRSYGNPEQQFLIGISLPESSTNISIGRNSRDLISSVSQFGLTRTYGYNSNYYVTSISNPETGTTNYGRDEAGNMTSRTVGNSATVNYSYDGQNRLASVTYPSGTASVKNVYNRIHKLLEANATSGNRKYTYDDNGNLSTEKLQVDGLEFIVAYEYNNLDQLSAITYPKSGTKVSYFPDVLGRPTAVSGYVRQVTYWPSGQIQQIDYENGTISKYAQNSRLWPSTFSTEKANKGVYVNNAYTYDGTGNVSEIKDTSDSAYSRAFVYDKVGRIIGASGISWGGTFTYDGAGNLAEQKLGAVNLNYFYDSNNRLSSLSGSRTASYGYDAYGNIVRDANNSYQYDDVPSLRCVNCGESSRKEEYQYDATNQRVSTVKSGVRTYEIYGSNGNLLFEFSSSPKKRELAYIYLGGKRIAQKETTDKSTNWLAPIIEYMLAD